MQFLICKKAISAQGLIILFAIAAIIAKQQQEEGQFHLNDFQEKVEL